MEEIKKLLEDCECTGYRCPHEISGKHYVMIPEDVDDLINLAVSKEREKTQENINKIAELLEGIGSGAYSQDHLKHAENVIEDALEIKSKIGEIINLINTK